MNPAHHSCFDVHGSATLYTGQEFMQDDTDIGGNETSFSTTRLSAIVAASSQDNEVRTHAYERIISVYWKPVYKYIRVRWHKSNEDAKDLTQAFFTKIMEKGFINSYDPKKSRFRTFLRVCLDRFLSNDEKAATRIKRGGNTQLLSLDFESIDEELRLTDSHSRNETEEYFDKEWVRHLFGIAVSKLKNRYDSSGKTVYFKLFELYHLADEADGVVPTYEQLSSQFHLSISTVTNYLASARKDFRTIVLEELRGVTATDEEFRQEARELLSINPD
jgi:RNA polymerase sigma factor (sigma-70 family)